MEQLTLEYTTSNAGLLRAVPLMQRALKIGSGAAWFTFLVCAVVAFGLTGFAEASIRGYLPGTPRGLLFIVGVAVLLAILFGLLLPWIKRRTIKRLDHLLPPTVTSFMVDDLGVTVRDEFSHGHWRWQQIRGAIATPDGVAVLMGYSGMFIPGSAFRDPAELANFIELVNRRSDRAGV